MTVSAEQVFSLEQTFLPLYYFAQLQPRTISFTLLCAWVISLGTFPISFQTQESKPQEFKFLSSHLVRDL